VQLVIDNEFIMKNKINRRKFFGLTAIVSLGTALFAKSPLKFADKSERIILNRKVKLHPSAIKRTK